MTTFAFLHGSGDGGWAWRLVRQALAGRGHLSVAPDLPTDRYGVTWDDCVAAVAAAVGEEEDDLVVVGHSAGGFLVPLVADRLEARLQVYVAGMVPEPGETPMEWFEHLDWWAAVEEAAAHDGGLTGSQDVEVAHFHDVDEELTEDALVHQRRTSDSLGEAPLPIDTWPDLPAAYVVTTQDRFIPPAVQRRAASRIGISRPVEIDSGHCPHLSRPVELAGLLAELSPPTRRDGG